MKLYIFLLFGWLFSFCESQRKETYDIVLTLSNFSEKIKDECQQHLDNCMYLKDTLFELIKLQIPSEILTGRNTTKLISGFTQGSMKWEINLTLQTSFPGGLNISLSCRTFSGLFIKGINKTNELSRVDVYTTIDMINPPVPPYDPRTATDALYKVEGKLCDNERVLYTASQCETFNNTKLLYYLKHHSYFSDFMTISLITAENVTMSNLTKVVEGDSCAVSLILELPKSYVKELTIDPFCNVASLMELAFNSKHQAVYRLCDAKVTALTPIIVTTPITPIITITPEITPALASTVGSSVYILALALVIRYMLADI